MSRTVWTALLLAAPALCADGQPLFNGRNLDGWEVRGEGVWSVLPDGVLLGSRRHANIGNPFGEAWPVTRSQWSAWLYNQAWLYTTRDFGQYDLHVEYWIPPGANSGISIRDVSRAHYAIREPENLALKLPTNLKGTPAHVGYEIQIIDPDNDQYPAGSVYLFAPARRGLEKTAAWNSLDIESRNEVIRVKVNGQPAAESPGDPARSRTGPIGLQLHDRFTFAMFRNIRIREIQAAKK